MAGPLDRAALFVFVERHLFYEIESVAWFTSLIAENEAGTPEHRAAFEAFLLHVRALDEFFRNSAEAARHDDVVAGHVVPDWEPSEILDVADRKLLHKAIAHVSAVRALEVGKRWPYGRYAARVAELVERFAEMIDDEDVSVRMLEAGELVRDHLDWAVRSVSELLSPDPVTLGDLMTGS